MTLNVSVSATAACSSSAMPQLAASISNRNVSLISKPPRSLWRRVHGCADRNVAQLCRVAGQVRVAGRIAALAEEVRDDARVRRGRESARIRGRHRERHVLIDVADRALPPLRGEVRARVVHGLVAERAFLPEQLLALRGLASREHAVADRTRGT